MPTVASTMSAPGFCSAGARSSTIRSRRTGTWRSWAIPRAFIGASFSCSLVAALVGLGCWGSVVPVAIPDFRSPTASKGVRPDNGEVRSGREAGGDLTSGAGWSPPRTSQESGNHLLGLIGKSLLGTGQVGVPGGRVPQLDTRSGADDGAFPGEPGVFAQRRRDRHPALAVGNLIRGPGQEHAQVVANGLAGHRRDAHGLGHSEELVHREDVQAPLLASGKHHTTGQALTELGRKEETAFVIESGGVRTKEHSAPASPFEDSFPVLDSHFYPLSSTLLHFAPRSTQYGWFWVSGTAFTQVNTVTRWWGEIMADRSSQAPVTNGTKWGKIEERRESL